MARELVALAPDVVVTSGTQAALAATAATRAVPIVMAIAQHPEEIGLVKSLARPGGNVTGLTTYSPQLTAKRLNYFKERFLQTFDEAYWTTRWNANEPDLRDQLEYLFNSMLQSPEYQLC